MKTKFKRDDSILENSIGEGLFYTNFEDDENDFDYEFDEVEEGSIKGLYNTWIVFGRDRPSSTGIDLLYNLKDGETPSDIINKLDGYGPKGFKKSGMIDIVAGRYSKRDASAIDFDNISVNPNFHEDACRIYISQRTDIDKNFNLVGGAYGSSENMSGIGIKADSVRIISRDTLKLFSSVHPELSIPGDDGRIRKSYGIKGIELIAGNSVTNGLNNDMQPIPKGENLRIAIKELAKLVFDTISILHTFATIQSDFNDVVGNHTHIENFQALTTTQSFSLIPQGKKTSFNMFQKIFGQCNIFTSNYMTYKTKYLQSASKKYILSKYHKLN